METLLVFVTLIALLYCCVMLAYRPQSKLRGVIGKRVFQTEVLQKLFEDAGLQVQAVRVNLIRFGGATLYLLYACVTGILTEGSLPVAPFLVASLWLLMTAPMPYTALAGLLLLFRRQTAMQKDGELIALLRLYENHRRKAGGVQLAAFCEQIASYLPLLQRDLMLLSQHITIEGLDEAFLWFRQQFPSGHPFINQVCMFIQTAERLGTEEAVRFIEENSRALSEISSDHYERRWKTIAPWMNVLNHVPTALTFIMVIMLLMYWIQILNNQTY